MGLRRYHINEGEVLAREIAKAAVGTEELTDDAVTTAKISDGAVTNAKVVTGTLTYDRLATDTIKVVVPFTIATISQSASASAVGTPEYSRYKFVIPTGALTHLKSATFVIDYEWAPTADGTIQLYDSTAAEVVAESTAKVGGEVSNWEEISVTGTLVEGNTYVARANITVAGGAGEAAVLHRAFLILTLGIS